MYGQSLHLLVQQTFHDWNTLEVDSYVAGVDDAQCGHPPDTDMLIDAQHQEDHALCYLRGYADELGDAAKSESWFGYIPDHEIDWEWWTLET